MEVRLSALRDILFRCTAMICCAGCHLVLRVFTAVSSGLRKNLSGNWLYLRLMIKNVGAFVKAAFGDNEELDILFDKLFYDYND